MNDERARFRCLGAARSGGWSCGGCIRAAAKTPLLSVAVLASLIMGAVLWVALPKHLPPLVLIGLGCAVYAISWAAIGRNLLKKEVEGIV